MKFLEITIRTNPKETLFATLKAHRDERVLLMMSNDFFEELIKRADVTCKMNSRGERDKVAACNIYENENIITCKQTGSAIFERICGMWVMKKFLCPILTYNYPFSREPEILIYLTR